MSGDEVNVLAERELVRLLRDVGLDDAGFAALLRVEHDALSMMLADPGALPLDARLRLAGALRARAEEATNPAWARIIVERLWDGALAMLVAQVCELAQRGEQGAVDQAVLEAIGPHGFEIYTTVRDKLREARA